MIYPLVPATQYSFIKIVMPRVTIEISTDDANYLVHKTKQKWYFENAGRIFANAKIIEMKTLEWEEWINLS